tara:strand:- start:4859 stop:7150 length:2292 start_codon:yes stop_codon:yes gene_type:complete
MINNQKGNIAITIILATLMLVATPFVSIASADSGENQDSDLYDYETGCEEYQFPNGILNTHLVQSIVVFEQTSDLYEHSFSTNPASSSFEMLVEDIKEGQNNADFSGWNEYYDVYISDSNGAVNPNGSFITIDGYSASNKGNNAAGFNIDSIVVSMSGGISEYPEVITHVEIGNDLSGNYLSSDGYAARILGESDAMSTRLGNQNSSITVGFCVDNGDNEGNDQDNSRLECDEDTEYGSKYIYSNSISTVVTNSWMPAYEINPHPNWDANIANATWVWNTSDGYGHLGPVRFAHEFTIPTNAVEFAGVITVAADNSYEIMMNGNLVGEETDEWNFRHDEIEDYQISNDLVTGLNTIYFEVNNWHVIGGLMYSGAIEFCLENQSNSSGNNSIGNSTGNSTGGNNTGGNSTGNGTGNDCGNQTYCDGEIVYAIIEEQWGTFDHKISVKTESLSVGFSYTLDWEVTDDNQQIIYSGTDSWSATQSTHYTYYANMDLLEGLNCVTAKLYQNGIHVDTRDSCIVIQNNSAEIVYAIIEEQWGTFDHKISMKTGGLSNSVSYTLDWELVDDNQQIVSTGSDSWTAAQSTHYTYDTNLDLAAGLHCVTAWLYESGSLVDTATSCTNVQCDSNNTGEGENDNPTGNETNETDSNEDGGSESEPWINEGDNNNESNQDGQSEGEPWIGEDDNNNESEDWEAYSTSSDSESEPSIIEKIVNAIAMAISDLIEEFLSDSDQGESETESEVDEESQTDFMEDSVEVDQKITSESS